jgi:3-hydroxybutyryl-CoA dehydratase
MPAPRFYFEDVVLHGVVETPALTLTEAHVALYAGLSQDAAPEPGLVPELLPLCLTTGLGWRIDNPPLAVLAFMGFEWEVLQPVRVGDTIHSRSRTAVKRSMREGGVIVEERQVINQRGDVVHRGRFTFLVAKRPV